MLQVEGTGVLPGDAYHWGGRNTERETINTKITIYTVKCLNGSDDIPKHGLICESLFAGSHFMCTFFF